MTRPVMDLRATPAEGYLIGDAEAFYAGIWQRRAATYVPRSNLLADLGPGWTARLLHNGLLRVPFVTVTRLSERLPPASYTRALMAGATPLPGFVDHRALVDALRSGYTVMVNSLELWDRQIQVIAAELSATFKRYVEVVGFFTPSGTQGLPVHRDGPDLFVIQLAGTKDWRVHSGPAGPDWAEGAADEPGPVSLECTLAPGDVLYLPRGTAHEARATDRFSVHLTVGVRGLTRSLVVSALSQLLTARLTIGLRPRTDAEERECLRAAWDEAVRLLAATPSEAIMNEILTNDVFAPVPVPLDLGAADLREELQWS